jgi:acetylornithine deacetylase
LLTDDRLVERLRAAVAGRRGELVELTRALVRERSLIGDEEGAQRLIADRLSGLGFTVQRIEIDPPGDESDPTWGYPPSPYDGRTCVAGRIEGAGSGRSLHLSGHVDVVPVESAAQWDHDPWRERPPVGVCGDAGPAT